VRKLLAKTGLKAADIDVFELNEAFASQSLYCIKELGLDAKKVNPNGGAIALGHPLGCTGARQIATLLPEMKRRGAKRGVVTMCVGGGMGAAALIETV
jgi:acetyl-CoA acyltransferase